MKNIYRWVGQRVIFTQSAPSSRFQVVKKRLTSVNKTWHSSSKSFSIWISNKNTIHNSIKWFVITTGHYYCTTKKQDFTLPQDFSACHLFWWQRTGVADAMTRDSEPSPSHLNTDWNPRCNCMYLCHMVAPELDQPVMQVASPPPLRSKGGYNSVM